MSVDHQKLQNKLQRLEEKQAKRQKVKEFEDQQNQLAQSRSRAQVAAGRTRIVSEDIPEDINAQRQMFPSHESYDSPDDGGEYSVYPVPPPSATERPSPGPAAPTEETLKCFATTVAYSSYSRLCGTSDDSLIHHLFQGELRKESSAVFGPKKMIEIPHGRHNITFLRKELAEGATSPFVTSMVEARRRVDPEVTTDDHVRRLGPAEILDDSLPIYWIVTFSQRGAIDWEGGCTLARAYRRVFEEFGTDEVHCLVFEYEEDVSGEGGQKAFALE